MKQFERWMREIDYFVKEMEIKREWIEELDEELEQEVKQMEKRMKKIKSTRGERDDNIFEGEMQGTLAHGLGIYTYSNGAICKGEFQKGKRHGLGIVVLPSGNRFIGHYVMEKKEGYGRFIHEKGEYYRGFFRNDLKHGFHFTTNSTGSIIGYVVNECMSHQINYENATTTITMDAKPMQLCLSREGNKILYLGNIIEGRKQGHGYFHNGPDIFLGIFENDKMIRVLERLPHWQKEASFQLNRLYDVRFWWK